MGWSSKRRLACAQRVLLASRANRFEGAHAAHANICLCTLGRREYTMVHRCLFMDRRNASQNEKHSTRLGQDDVQDCLSPWLGQDVCADLLPFGWWRCAIVYCGCVGKSASAPHFANDVVDCRMPRAQPPRAHGRSRFALGRSFATSGRCRSILVDVGHRGTWATFETESVGRKLRQQCARFASRTRHGTAAAGGRKPRQKEFHNTIVSSLV